ncbi:Fc.00g081460.m01.CDS01 [Cosmosporella sp. VM-42]
MDQTSIDSARDVSKSILAKTDEISILIYNAGIMGVPEVQLSKDGYELQFATNHLPLLFHFSSPHF